MLKKKIRLKYSNMIKYYRFQRIKITKKMLNYQTCKIAQGKGYH